MPKFKNGVSLNRIKDRKSNGKPIKYLRISAGPLRGQYVHRLIVEARIGRLLNDWEHIDHEDGNTLNDRPSNLSDPLSASEHALRTNARELEKFRKTQKKPEKKERSTDFNFGANEVGE